MKPLFAGEPRALPSQAITAEHASQPRVRHAIGYERFVALAARHGTDPRALLDLWAFAHLVRAHREALEGDHELLLSAVVFLGNVLITNRPDCVWARSAEPWIETEQRDTGAADDPRVGPGGPRMIGVGGTVPAILDADEQRFAEFEGVVRDWSPSAPPPVRGYRDV